MFNPNCTTMEIQLSAIRDMIFGTDDVANNEEKQALRKYNLRKALALGNLYKRKVLIYFRSVDGMLRRIETTVWAVGEEYISLKAGVSLPIKSVEKIEF